MIQNKYSKIRFLLTEASRLLSVLAEALKHRHVDTIAISEVEYWSSSLELLRNCLYACTSDYTGKLGIRESVKEIRQDLSDFYTNTKGTLSKRDYDKINEAWTKCNKIEKELR